jgi:hypothetical protein
MVTGLLSLGGIVALLLGYPAQGNTLFALGV